MRGLVIAACLVMAWGEIGQVSAADVVPRFYDISAQPLDTALEGYSVVSRVQVLYDSRLAAAKTSTALRGEFLPETALKILLSGTGLVGRYTDARDVVITDPALAANTKLNNRNVSDGPKIVNSIAGVLTLKTLRIEDGAKKNGNYRRYAGIVKTDIQNALRTDKRTRKGRYRIGIKLWIGGKRSRFEDGDRRFFRRSLSRRGRRPCVGEYCHKSETAGRHAATGAHRYLGVVRLMVFKKSCGIADLFFWRAGELRGRHLVVIALGVVGALVTAFVMQASEGGAGRQYGSGRAVMVRLIPSLGPPPASPSPATRVQGGPADPAEDKHFQEEKSEVRLHKEISPQPAGTDTESEANPEPPRNPSRTVDATKDSAVGPEMAAADDPPPIFGRNGGTSLGAVEDFQRVLFAHIERFQRYPAVARREKLAGTVQVVFVMQRDGTVLEARVSQSSGFPILDQEALEMIWRARPLPPIPSEMARHLTIVLPVEFSAHS